MVPGSAVLALAIEHTWAVDLVNAMDAQGVEVALSFRVPAPIVEDAFASLTPNQYRRLKCQVYYEQWQQPRSSPVRRPLPAMR
jgi:hypothetical protein